MSYYVRFMRPEDVVQASDIDREAFPGQWPPPNFQHELRNQLAHYIVACNPDKTIDKPEQKATTEPNLTRRVFSKLGRLFSHNHSFNNELLPTARDCIFGFAGFWIMADEAHITTIAVRESHRHQGIGELLLMSLIDLATRLKARTATLEVRVSNTIAQNLYTKYGFTQAGIRRGYYLDNREDALLMTIQDLTQATFQAHLQQLKQALSQKYSSALH